MDHYEHSTWLIAEEIAGLFLPTMPYKFGKEISKTQT
jgi:hypothetical protein